ncbi:MAG TPA: sigma 54-interacting transcriptional regulator [Candidatus Methylomirabilis sp.]|nr:sigma 54-interacting transcriptional regulator [Candidatus Methylomirabilis sp.]
METLTQPSMMGMEETTALRAIVEGTATETGERFFAALVENLAGALGTHGAWVTEYLPGTRELRALAFWMGGAWVQNWKMAIDGTPCEAVIESVGLVHYPENLVELFPNDPELKRLHAVSYMGVPLLDVNGRILGNLAILDTRPMPEQPRALALFRIFAARAAAELRRLRAESELREREEKLGRLVDSAMDGILELDQELRVTRMNAAAERIFGCAPREMIGRDFEQFLSEESRGKLASLIGELDVRPEGQRFLWIPGGLTAKGSGGREFPAEATLSRFEMLRQTFHTLVLRNVNDRLEAEQKIQSLTAQAAYLQEEIKTLHNFEDIIGRSKSLLRILQDVQEVAATDTTVLILGETGTGKELIARAIHAASLRRDRPLIKLNCAAMPAMLIESELFGHEKGAFTGAARRRDGRFSLANGGTIFLDEVGEMPLDLQAKLLRVIQDGEFEPVGSSQTKKVDVRIIAATNRDLAQAVKEGDFREDLYYRLNVFPIMLPPLRERGEDVALIASVFARRFAHRLGRRIEPLSQECIRRMQAYSWPGNVRELMSVIERAVITSRNGRLNLDRALPESTGDAVTTPASSNGAGTRIRTARELEELERQNLLCALETTRWRVAGDNGAARLLGINPSTLNSRLKALGISRPRPA